MRFEEDFYDPPDGQPWTLSGHNKAMRTQVFYLLGLRIEIEGVDEYLGPLMEKIEKEIPNEVQT